MVALLLGQFTHTDREIERRPEPLEPELSLEVVLIYHPPIASKLTVERLNLRSLQRWNATATGNALPRRELSHPTSSQRLLRRKSP